jgi:hypothetical protein
MIALSIAVHALLATSDSGEFLLVIVSAVGGMLLTALYLDSYKSRAAAHDHVVEASRDILIPDHCADCGAPHAKHALRIFRKRPNASRYQAVADVLADPKSKREYWFRFCERCARPIIRRRRLGFLLKVWSIAPLLHFASMFFIRPIAEIADAMRPGAAKWFAAAFSSAWLLPDIVAAFVIFFAGLFLSVSARAVKIVDPGGDRLFYAFTNQVYRNHFAELNGER